MADCLLKLGASEGGSQPTWATEHLPLALDPVLARIGPAAVTLCLPSAQIEQPVAVAPWLQLVHLAVLSTCSHQPSGLDHNTITQTQWHECHRQPVTAASGAS